MKRSHCPRGEDIGQSLNTQRSIISKEENDQLKKILNIFKTLVTTTKDQKEHLPEKDEMREMIETTEHLTSTRVNEKDEALKTKEEWQEHQAGLASAL